ncbi:hypothetical protein U9M48_015007 [Paspalum notatum var. saurae]|uniref:ER lumen protein retaining receptor n=1 Tax=Paspalum notatum var. saurae TaxID=547442 RepID=A0AAQ3T3C9_PASNO
MRGTKRPLGAVTSWVRRQPPKVKAFLAVVTGMAALVFIRFIVHDHDNLFVAAEAAHALGIGVLIYKLTKEKTCAGSFPSAPLTPVLDLSRSPGPCPRRYGLGFCINALLYEESKSFKAFYFHLAGLSLKSQDLTALFLAVRLYCSFVMEYDIHTILDTATLIATLFVIYMIRFKLRSTYMVDKDNFALYYVVVPCAVLALLIHPSTSHNIVNRISWAFCVYLEAVSVLPQLRLMQNTKIVEPFTAHYVFALGVARFLSCAHWVLQVLDTRGRLLTALGYGLWPSMVLLSEIVQTFILADFCYYYVKSLVGGQLVLRLPSGVV